MILFHCSREGIVKEEMCCFCGKWEKKGILIPLVLFINKKNEQQGFMCHKKCIVKLLNDSIMLHPDLEEYRVGKIEVSPIVRSLEE